MKRFKILVAMMSVMSLCTPSFYVMAANNQGKYTNENTERILISKTIENYEDGTSSVERIYVHSPSSASTVYTPYYDGMDVNVQEEYMDENTKGILISETIENYEDGTSSVERIYVQNPSSTRATFGTDTFTKTKSWHTGLGGNGPLLITLSVTGTFDWDSTTKKVKVYDVSGEIVEVNGKTSDEKTYTSGNNTSKATATFSCKRLTNDITYKVSISCNYKGTDS